MFTSGNLTVDAVGQLHLEGNTIPHMWYENIRFENDKPDLNAIIILAEIVYWYRPTYVKDETTGHVKGVKKRFSADLLQRSYDSFGIQFGISKRQARDAIVRLENKGLLKRHFRTINPNGTPLSNVLFIELNVGTLESMTFQRQMVSHPNVRGCGVEMLDVSHPNVTPMTTECQTYTEITTEITTRDLNNVDDKVQDPASTEVYQKQLTAFQFYEQNGFGALASHVAYKVGNWIDDLSEVLVIHAMKLAVENNVLRWNYVEKILLDWSNKKFRTIEDVEADRLRFEAQKNQRQKNSNRTKQQGRQELVPEWFDKRNEDNRESQSTGQTMDFEAERQKVLEMLGKGSSNEK
ncbi:DNA replication protein DnaD [Lysinibacillus sp. B2A1]|nr:DNA replication protein DnaD [Lysinibacillus sp. B2A1]